MARSWNYLGQGYGTRSWDKASAKDMGHGAGVCGMEQDMWQGQGYGYGTSVWEKVWDEEIGHVPVARAWDYGTRVWYKDMGQGRDKGMV